MTIAAAYAEFGEREARGVSPAYERLSVGGRPGREILALVATLPPVKRQPNLLFGVVRLLGGPVERPGGVPRLHRGELAGDRGRDARPGHPDERGRPVRRTAACPLRLPQPLALLEVGASAGLCLYPDRYAYRYGDHAIGAGDPVLECAATGRTPPAGGPRWCGGPGWT